MKADAALTEIRRLVRPIRVNLDLQGTDVLDGILSLGGRAGPESHYGNVMHELCHFIEIDDKRCLVPNWGFNYGRWIECPVSRQGGYYEARTRQHIDREARVWAFQHNLSRYLGFRSSVVELTSSARFMPDFWHWIKGETDEERLTVFAAEVKGLTEQPAFQAETAIKELKRKKTLVRAMKHA